MSYYFLISSLPHIALGEKPAISLDAFIELCEEHLTQSDMNALLALTGKKNAESRHSFLKSMNDKEVLLRNAIVKKRADRLKIDSSAYVRDSKEIDSNIEQAVDNAFTNLNPLEREMAIDKIRWTNYDEISTFDPFTSESVLAYAAKLKIAERWSALNRKQGKEIAQEMVERNPNIKENTPAEVSSPADQEN